MAASQDDLRAAAIALPHVVEKDHFGAPSFRVNGKIFAQMAVKSPGKAILKLPMERLELLGEARPEVFSRKFWGRAVYYEVDLSGLEPNELSEFVEASWRNVAPKELAAAR